MAALYLVATPIGNLEDISLRALRILREVGLVAAEDTRRTGKLLAHYEINTPLLSYHDHSDAGRIEELLGHLAQNDVALVTDAGSPLISDPGYELVNAALARGHKIIPVPGPSAVIASLSASGIPADSFLFIGYLPRKKSERRAALQRYTREPHTLVFFEVPHRLLAAMEDLVEVFGAGRQASVSRELTKLHEETLRGSLGELQSALEEQPPRGEYTLVIAGVEAEAEWSEDQVRQALAERLSQGDRPSEAARWVASRSGWTRRAVYQFTLEEE